MNRIELPEFSHLSIPLQLAASTIVMGFIGMKVGTWIYGDFGGALGLMVGLIAGFFTYLAVIVKREQ
jgi:zinc transporter ZupT